MKTILLRIIGYVGSLLLTLAAFYVILRPEFFHLSGRSATFAILIFGLLQFVVQFLFFLDLWREKGRYWNMVVFGSTLSIIVIVIAGSIWIMDHLNYNMMG